MNSFSKWVIPILALAGLVGLFALLRMSNSGGETSTTRSEDPLVRELHQEVQRLRELEKALQPKPYPMEITK